MIHYHLISLFFIAEIPGNLIRDIKNNVTNEGLVLDKLSQCAGEISQSISEWFPGNYV